MPTAACAQRRRAVVFHDRRAARLLVSYRRRASYALGSLSSAARQELMEDLDTHISEALSRHGERGSELTRLRIVIEDLGPPERFLAPLISAAVLIRPQPPIAVIAPYQAITMALQVGGRHVRSAATYLLALMVGIVIAGLTLTHLLAPSSAHIPSFDGFSGPFAVGGGDEPSIARALFLLHFGGVAIGWALRSLHDLALDIVVIEPD